MMICKCPKTVTNKHDNNRAIRDQSLGNMFTSNQLKGWEMRRSNSEKNIKTSSLNNVLYEVKSMKSMYCCNLLICSEFWCNDLYNVLYHLCLIYFSYKTDIFLLVAVSKVPNFIMLLHLPLK